jgi:hypothetical protein
LLNSATLAPSSKAAFKLPKTPKRVFITANALTASVSFLLDGVHVKPVEAHQVPREDIQHARTRVAPHLDVVFAFRRGDTKSDPKIDAGDASLLMGSIN